MINSNPNPDPSPAASGFLCLGKAAGEGKKIRKRAQPSFEHQLPVPAIVNEDNLINWSYPDLVDTEKVQNYTR